MQQHQPKDKAVKKREEIVNRHKLDDKFIKKFSALSLEDLIYLKLYYSIPKFPDKVYPLNLSKTTIQFVHKSLASIAQEIYGSDESSYRKINYFLGNYNWRYDAKLAPHPQSKNKPSTAS